MVDPKDYGALIPAEGSPLGAVFRIGWFRRLAGLLRAVNVCVPQGGYLTVHYTADGTVLETTRPIPLFFMMQATTGISAKDGTSGAWGTGSAKEFLTTYDGGAPEDALGTIVYTVNNRWPFSVASGKTFLAYEQGGNIFVAGYAC